MKILMPIGLGITFLFGMTLGSPSPGYEISIVGCVIGLMIALTGQVYCSYKERKRTCKSCRSYKFK